MTIIPPSLVEPLDLAQLINGKGETKLYFFYGTSRGEEYVLCYQKTGSAARMCDINDIYANLRRSSRSTLLEYTSTYTFKSSVMQAIH